MAELAMQYEGRMIVVPAGAADLSAFTAAVTFDATSARVNAQPSVVRKS